MMILTGIGLIVTFLWARDLFGMPAGIVAAGMYAFSPTCWLTAFSSQLMYLWPFSCC